jgi:hypothetical protein
VPHLVFSSVAGATQHSGVPHFDSKAVIETELTGSDGAHTILGPTYFFDNALGGQRRIRAGVLDLPLPADRPLQQLARPDLGAFAAEVLLNPAAYVGQRIELASDAPPPLRWPPPWALRSDGRYATSMCRSNRSAIPTWTQCGGSWQSRATKSTSRPCTAPTPVLVWTSFAEWATQTFEPAP